MTTAAITRLRGRVLHGPNRWSRLPMVHLVLDLGALDACPTDRIQGFSEHLLSALPGLLDHGCSEGRPGGFQSRLAAGTWLGHVVEHVALELQRAVGAGTTRGKTRSAGPRGVYDVVFAYEDEAVGRAAGEDAISLVNQLLQLGPDDDPSALGAARVADLRVLADRTRLGLSTQAIVDAARRRDIPVRRLDGRNLVQLGWGVHARRIRATVTSTTGLIGAEIARDKDEANRLLQAAAVPIPAWRLAATLEEAIAATAAVGLPAVIKPIDGNHGRGVTLGIEQKGAVGPAFTVAAAASRRARVLVQRQVAGRDHRILVVAGRMVACAERVPARVVGDGQHTIRELVAQADADPRRGVGHAQALTRIALDERALSVLDEQALTADAVPEAGRAVPLSRVANLSAGGTSIDRTDEVHRDVAAMAELAARVVGLDVAGVDLITTDIGRPLHETGGAIIEINAGPGFRMHTHPAEGRPRDVGSAVIDHLFGRTEGRIPVAAVTGSNGKTTTVRLLAHLLAGSGLAVGSATTEAIVADGLVLRTGDMAGPASARLLLSTPTIEAVVLEVARGGILRDGLGYDYNDVAVVTNVTGDHLGLGGIETLEQLADVKAVIVDAVPRSGTAVLNADDPLVLAMAARCRGAVALVSMSDDDSAGGQARAAHVASGELGGGVEKQGGEECLVVRRGATILVRVPVDAIPITLAGAARMHVANALAAACAAVALGLEGRVIEEGLRSFLRSPGRVQRQVVHGRDVILDYGHNLAALRSIGELVAGIAADRRVVAVVSMPGDRRDEDRIAYGTLAGTLFDTLVVAEPAVRGRPVGEAARILMDAAARTPDGAPSRAGAPIFVADEAEAACAALCSSNVDDLVVLCVADATRVLERLAGCPAVPRS